MTPTSQQQPRRLMRGNWLRLRSNPEQRPVPVPNRLGFVRLGDENLGVRGKRARRGTAGRGTGCLHGPAAEPGQVKWEMSANKGLDEASTRG